MYVNCTKEKIQPHYTTTINNYIVDMVRGITLLNDSYVAYEGNRMSRKQ